MSAAEFTVREELDGVRYGARPDWEGKMAISKEHEGECRAIIAVAEACWRKNEPSYSWHVFDWLCYRQSLKYPLVYPHSGFMCAAIVT